MAVNELNNKNREKYSRELKKEIEKVRTKFISEHTSVILNEISKNQSEIKDIGIIIYLFNKEESPIKYIRTEPLFSFKEKNFDVVLYGKENLVLISVKDNVQGGNVLKSINSLRDYSKEILENSQITDTEKGVKLKILDYFKNLVGGEIKRSEFILATQRPCINEIINKAKELEYNFCLWNIVEKENKAFITEERIVGKEGEDYPTHNLRELRDYLKKLKEKGLPYNDILTFIFSSSKYLKATRMSIPLSRINFNFDKWKSIFEIDLYGWHNFEKEIIYKNYINYGLDCNFIKAVEDGGDILKNNYKIVSICSRANLLEADIIKKIVNHKAKGELKIQVPSIKMKLRNNLLSQQAVERGESLNKFI